MHISEETKKCKKKPDEGSQSARKSGSPTRGERGKPIVEAFKWVLISKQIYLYYLASKFPSISILAPASNILSLVSRGSWKTLSSPSLWTRLQSSRADVARTIAFWCVHPLPVIRATTFGAGRATHMASKAALASLRRNLLVSAVLCSRGAASSSTSCWECLNYARVRHTLVKVAREAGEKNMVFSLFKVVNGSINYLWVPHNGFSTTPSLIREEIKLKSITTLFMVMHQN